VRPPLTPRALLVEVGADLSRDIEEEVVNMVWIFVYIFYKTTWNWSLCPLLMIQNEASENSNRLALLIRGWIES